MPELSILIPCRNDSASLEACVAAVEDVVTNASMNVETLIVDDGSTDGSLDLAQRLAETYPVLHIRILARNNRGDYGFGALLRYGMAFSGGRFCANRVAGRV